MIYLFQILVAWLLADLLAGFVHWFEDRYLSEDQTFNIFDSVQRENDLHHRKPTAMLLSTGWVNMRSAAIFGWPLAALLLYLGSPIWIWLVPFFASFGNLIHRWAHMPRRQLPRWIRGMQEFGLFISHEHHDAHHRSMQQLIPRHLAGYRFCAMTDWLNPWLDHFKIWDKLESVFRRLGLKTTKERRGE